MSVVLTQMPSAGALYLKAATTAFKRPKGRPQMPALDLRIEQQRIDPQHLADYRAVCGFGEGADVPITYPHVMAGALHLKMMTDPSFPVPLLGLVHIRNRIEQSRPLSVDTRYDVQVSLGESRDVRQGVEFDFLTRFDDNGETVWREVSTILFRMPAPKGSGAAARPAVSPSQLSEYQSFDAPADIGRRYAGVGRDYNPIHLTPLAARLFGFKRHIAHGMWSLARCAALLESSLGENPRLLDVQFKQPLFLPGKLTLRYRRTDEGIDYALLARNSDKVHLSGTLR